MRRGSIGVVAAGMALAAGSGTATAATAVSEFTGHGGIPIRAYYGADHGENNHLTVGILGQGTVTFADPNATIGTASGGLNEPQPCLVLGTHDAVCRVPWIRAASSYLLGITSSSSEQAAYAARVRDCILRGCDSYTLVKTLYNGDQWNLEHGIDINVGDGNNQLAFLPTLGRYPYLRVDTEGGSTATSLPASHISLFFGQLDSGPDRVTLGPTVVGGAVDTGAGIDTIDVRNGTLDSVDCGAGDDTVSADTIDVVAANCEHVTRG
jgi:hypothetical protein